MEDSSKKQNKKKTGCPQCKKRWNSSFPELALAFYISKITTVLHDYAIPDMKPYKAVDLYLPEKKVVIEYDGVQYHKKRIQQDQEKTDLLLGKGYRIIRIREKTLPSLESRDYLYSYMYKRNGNASVNKMIHEVIRLLYTLESLNELEETNLDIDVSRDGLEILKQLKPVQVSKNIADVVPALVDEWHFKRNSPFRPEHFRAGSNFKVWWKCPNGHEYSAQINSRKKGHGCRICAGQEATKENCLQTLFPDIAKEWDYQRNGDLTPVTITAHSNKKVYWICTTCRSSYDKSVNSRTRKDKPENCPYCAGKRVNETNSLAALFPDLVKEWHPTKNKKSPHEVTKGSHYKAYWVCELGHEYRSFVYSRVSGKGCKACYEECRRKKPRT